VHPERSVPDELLPILRRGLLAHVGIVDEGVPVVIPMNYQLDESPLTIYLHSAHHGRLLHVAAGGGPVCVTVTMIDGLIYSKSAKYHSTNYRSAVCFGAGRLVSDPAVVQRLARELVARYYPGRAEGVDYAPIPQAHLDATMFVAIDVTEASAKARTGGPKGPGDADPTVPGTAGLFPWTASELVPDERWRGPGA